MSATEPAIRVSGLTKTYGAVEALSPLDMDIRPNTITALLGPNGAGKTTLIRMLMGLVVPSGGDASILGQSVASRGVAARSRLGYLAQDPTFYPHMTVREVLTYSAQFHLKGHQIDHRVDETLDLVGLAGIADRHVRGLSGGETQRVGIGQAYVHRPDVLILDEPAASLDPIGRRDMLDIVRGLRGHVTILYSTHILDDVERVADEVAVLNAGELVAQRPISELRRGPDTDVYMVSVRGAVDSARDLLAAQPWVRAIDVQTRDDMSVWRVEVDDRGSAESQLLPLLLAEGNVQVLSWGRRKSDLEDYFVDLVSKGAK